MPSNFRTERASLACEQARYIRRYRREVEGSGEINTRVPRVPSLDELRARRRYSRRYQRRASRVQLGALLAALGVNPCAY